MYMTFGVNPESAKAFPGHPHGSIPHASTGETTEISRTEVRLCGSLFTVTILVVAAVFIITVLPVVLGLPGYWPLPVLSFVALLLKASRQSTLRRFHYRRA